uniref:Uncharacterized protein n=1 Tax=Catharus ustulatus TaxID=91951 RepID=A0A8C3V019_CATUS
MVCMYSWQRWKHSNFLRTPYTWTCLRDVSIFPCRISLVSLLVGRALVSFTLLSAGCNPSEARI